MKYFISITVSIIAFLFVNSTYAQSVQEYKILKTFHIACSGGWDYIAVNNNKLYVSHGTQVNILDKMTGDSLGVIPNTIGVHGIAFVPSLNKGFTSNGRLNTVTVFDLTSNKILDSIPTGENPDAIFYDDYSKKIITCNGRRKDLSVIDPETDKVTATIALTGKPETAVSNGEGKIFVNNEDKSEIAVVDITSNKVIANWPISPGEAPSGLSIDKKNNRLFAGCDNKLLMVGDATDGNIIAKLPIGDGCDGTAFDSSSGIVYSSNGDGTLTVLKEISKNNYKVLENIQTKRGARTLCVDPDSHYIYLPTADFGPANGNERPPMLPGTFQVLVVKKEK